MEPLRCKMCNGPLVVDDSGDYAVCEYCGTKHTRETIQKMMKVEVTNPVRIQEEPIEEKLEKVRTFINLGQYNKALELCKTILEKYPNDYRGWWYQYLAETNCLNYDKINKQKTDEVNHILQKLNSSAHTKAMPIIEAAREAAYASSLSKPYGPEMGDAYARRGCIGYPATVFGVLCLVVSVWCEAPNLIAYAIICLIVGVVCFLMRKSARSDYNEQLSSWESTVSSAKSRLSQVKSNYDLFSFEKKK